VVVEVVLPVLGHCGVTVTFLQAVAILGDLGACVAITPLPHSAS